MSDTDRELRTENLPVQIDDGFEDSSNSDRLLQGKRAICIDGEWTLPDGMDIPRDKRFLVLGTAEGLQLWENGELIKEIIKKPNEPLPDVQALNDKISKDTWEDGINGPRPPWAHQYAVYLLDPTDCSIFTFMNSTNGAMIAVRALKSRVKWKRALLGGRKVSPIVTLGSQLVSRQFKKMGPDFIIVDWRDFDPLPPVKAEPHQLENPVEQERLNDPVEDIGRPVAEPSMTEIMDDKIPEDDWLPPGEPPQKDSVKEAGKAPAAHHATTKRGVTRITHNK